MGMQAKNETSRQKRINLINSRLHVVEDIEGFKWCWLEGQCYVNIRHLKEFYDIFND